MSLGSRQHKISLYADDVLLFLSYPEVSVPRDVNLIQEFGQCSGYKIIFSESVALFIGNKKPTSQPLSFPFKCSEDGFVYLGINMTPTCRQLYKANFVPVIEKNMWGFKQMDSSPSVLARKDCSGKRECPARYIRYKWFFFFFFFEQPIKNKIKYEYTIIVLPHTEEKTISENNQYKLFLF